jgi:hypothetical protein
MPERMQVGETFYLHADGSKVARYIKKPRNRYSNLYKRLDS